ncbi:MAG: VCBS repeat-containing protein [SAR324 cluster bacterium]|nr:VCBS repeat-containing protein [SAR324 cluster bacterium]
MMSLSLVFSIANLNDIKPFFTLCIELMLSKSFRSSDHKYRFYGSGLVLSIAFLLLAIVLFKTPTTPISLERSARQNTQHSIPTKNHVPVFHDRTLQAGLYFVHHQRGKKLTGLTETMGSGACAMDYDQDGWMDLFLVNGTGQTYFYGQSQWWQQKKGHALYRNTGNAQFENVTSEAGLLQSSWGMGCVAGDLDNDGDSDLFITNFGENRLYRNNGDGTFDDITKNSGIAGKRWSTSVTLADYDKDGWLDIYVVNFIRYQKGANTLEEGRGFQMKVPPSFDARLYDSEENRLYRNLGNLQFQDETVHAGVADASGRGLSSIWLDLDGNQYPDLVVANGEGSPNAVFLNSGNGTFQEAGSFFRLNTPYSSTGVAFGDLDRDGDLDLVMGSDSGYPVQLFINQKSSISFQSNFNLSKKPLHDQARDRGVTDEQLIGFANRGLGLFDLNNDGWLDLFMTNGWHIPDLDNPASTQGQRKLLWINQGDGMFQYDLTSSEALTANLSARSAVFADFDNDGDMDIYVSHNNDLGQLLINETKPQHWLGIVLENSTGNRDAIGAKVWLKTPESRQFQTVHRGEGYLSSNDPRIHFGLGLETQIDQITVQWPDGIQTNYTEIPVDHYVTISKDQPQFIIKRAASSHNLDRAMKLQMGAEKAENRSQYLLWTAEHDTISEQLREIEIAIHDPDASVRKTAINISGTMNGKQGIPILITALDDLNPSNRIEALQALQHHEQDVLVRWFLRSFHDPAPQVRCAVADAFASFFREEEAVIHRKHTAIPELIRLLSDQNPTVRKCAARALGYSENFRAVGPLLQLMGDQVEEVRLTAIRALGLIREQRVIPSLHRVFHDPSQSPEMKAQILIALKRLHDLEWIFLFKNLFPPLDEIELHLEEANTVLKILQAIHGDYQDGVVISHQSLHESVLEWLGSPDDLFLSEIPGTIALSVLETLGKLRSPYLFIVTDQLMHHRDAVVRMGAYHLLLRLDNDYFVSNVPVSLLLKRLGDAATRLLAIKALAQYSEEGMVQKALLRIIEDKEQPLENRLEAFNSLENKKNHRVLSDYLYRDSSELIRAASLRYWAKQEPPNLQGTHTPFPLIHSIQDQNIVVRQVAVDIALQQKHIWAKQFLNTIILDTNQPLSLRMQILNGLLESKAEVYLDILLQLTKWRHDPIFKNAISGLGLFEDQTTEQYLWKLLKNKKEQIEVRWQAAAALKHRYPKEVLQYVRSRESL